MKLSLCAVSLALVGAALAWPASAQSAEASASAFDGLWLVQLACPDAQDRKGPVKGYEFAFDATVTAGRLHGERGAPGARSSLVFDGTVASDGALAIEASGHTGNSDYVVSKLAQGSAYSYTMTGKLEGTHGHALCETVRACTATFTKR